MRNLVVVRGISQAYPSASAMNCRPSALTPGTARNRSPSCSCRLSRHRVESAAAGSQDADRSGKIDLKELNHLLRRRTEPPLELEITVLQANPPRKPAAPLTSRGASVASLRVRLEPARASRASVRAALSWRRRAS